MKTSSSKKNEKGQGLVEYSMILVLVAIVVIASVNVVGPVLSDIFRSGITDMGEGSHNYGPVIMQAELPGGGCPEGQFLQGHFCYQ